LLFFLRSLPDTGEEKRREEKRREEKRREEKKRRTEEKSFSKLKKGLLPVWAQDILILFPGLFL